MGDPTGSESLFLLEILVDSVDMEGNCDCSAPDTETCVAFQFFDNDPLEICEADFCPNRKYGNEPVDYIKSGKSCLFSLSAAQIETAQDEFDVLVSIIKKMPPGWLPERRIVGNCLISIANLFYELIRAQKKMECDCESGGTGKPAAAKTLKDVFDLVNNSGCPIGKISIYMRMSCFGKQIVTQFQMNLNDQSVLFKDNQGQSTYRYKRSKKPVCECPPPECMPNACCPLQPCRNTGSSSKGTSRQCVPRPCCTPACPPPPCYPPPCCGAPCPPTPCCGLPCPPPPCCGMPCPPPGCCPPPPGCCPPPPGCCPPPPGCCPPPPGCCPLPPECCPPPPGCCPPPPGCCPPPPLCPPPPSCCPPPTCPPPGSCQPSPCFPPPPCPPPGCCQPCPPPPGCCSPRPCCPPPCPPQAPCNECQYDPCNPPACMMQQAQAQCMGLVPCNECGMYIRPCVGQCLPPCGVCGKCHCPPCPPPPEPGNYQEIGASLGGNALTIRVHKDKAKIEPVCGDGASASAGGQSGTPNSYNFPTAGQTNSPFTIKVGGPCAQGGNNAGSGGREGVVVQPPACTAKDGTTYTEIADPNKEKFVLRIGKKNEGADKKANLELELCTPRGPDIKPIPKKETRDCQYDIKDIPGEKGSRTSRSSGKGGKKGKKKKK